MTFEPANDQQAVFQELEAAKSAFATGNYAVAEPLLRPVLEKLINYPAEGALVTEYLSEIYTAWGKFSEAIKLNQRFINVTAPLGGNQFDLIGATLERISAISLKVGKTEQSEKLARLAAAVRAGKIDVMTLTTQHAKVPMAPPMTEHTVQIRALGEEKLGSPSGAADASMGQSVPPAPSPVQPSAQPSLQQSAPPQQAAPQTPRISQQQIPSLQIPSTGLNPPAFQPQGGASPNAGAESGGRPNAGDQNAGSQNAALAPGANFPHELQRNQAPSQSEQNLAPADPLRRPTKDTGMLNRPDYSQVVADAAMSAQQGSPAAMPTSPVQSQMQQPLQQPTQPSPGQSQYQQQAPQVMPPRMQQPAAQPMSPNPSPQPLEQQTAYPPQAPQQFQSPLASYTPTSTTTQTPAPAHAPMQAPVAPQPIQSYSQSPQPVTADAYIPDDEPVSWGEPEPESEPAFEPEQSYPSESQISSPHIPDEPQFPRAHSSPTQDLPQHFGNEFPQQGVLEASLSSGGETEASSAPASQTRSQASLPSVGFSTESISLDKGGTTGSAEPGIVKSSSAGRSIRNLSARDMEAAPISGPDMSGFIGALAGFVVGKKATDQHVQQVVNKSELSLRIAGILVLTVGIFCTTAYAAYKLSPRKLSADKAYLTIQHRYRSADNTKTLSLTDPATADYSAEKIHFKTPMKIYLDDWQDAVDVALGRATQKQYWLNVSDSAVTDQDGITLYVDGGPETEIANKVEIIAEYAKTCYLRDKKYPTSADLLEKADLSYTNPFTKKKTYPTFNKTTVSKGTSALDSDNERTDFYHTLVSGGSWSDAPKPSPGEIRCCAVDFLSPRGTIQGFFVQLFDKDGKSLSGVRPKTSYLYALEDGKEYKVVENAELPMGGQQSLRTVTTWLFMDKLTALLEFMLMSGPAIVFTALAFVFTIMTFIVPNGVARIVAGTLLLCTALPAVVFCFSKVLP